MSSSAVAEGLGLVSYTDSSDDCDSEEDESPVGVGVRSENGHDRTKTEQKPDSKLDTNLCHVSDSTLPQEEMVHTELRGFPIPNFHWQADNEDLDKSCEDEVASKRRKLECKDDNPKIPVKSVKNDLTILTPRKEKETLNLPSSIHMMFGDGPHRKWMDNPEEHSNRVRSFPHVEGNWATTVYIPVQADARFVQFVHDLADSFQSQQFEIMKEFHVSLSRTVVIRHHWIESLVDSLRSNLAGLQSCIADLKEIRLYTNDDKTRTFLCIELSQEDTLFGDYVKAVDTSFAEFKLSQYYQNPSYHISVGWCLGDITHSLSQTQLDKVKALLGTFCAANPDLSVVFARHICCKSGNKSFFIPLEDAD